MADAITRKLTPEGVDIARRPLAAPTPAPAPALLPAEKSTAQMAFEDTVASERRLHAQGGKFPVAFGQFNPTTNLVKGLAEQSRGAAGFDPDFRVTPEMLKESEARLGITENSERLDAFEYLNEAFSADDYAQRLDSYEQSKAQMRDLFEGGAASGFGAAVLASMLDPTALTAVGIAKLAPVMAALKDASRLRRAGAFGALGATEGAVMESFTAYGNPTMDEDDVAMAVILGGGLGAGMGAAFKSLAKGTHSIEEAGELTQESFRRANKRWDEMSAEDYDNGLPDEGDIGVFRAKLDDEEIVAQSDDFAPVDTPEEVLTTAETVVSRDLANELHGVRANAAAEGKASTTGATPTKAELMLMPMKSLQSMAKALGIKGGRSKASMADALHPELERISKPAPDSTGALKLAKERLERLQAEDEAFLKTQETTSVDEDAAGGGEMLEEGAALPTRGRRRATESDARAERFAEMRALRNEIAALEKPNAVKQPSDSAGAARVKAEGVGLTEQGEPTAGLDSLAPSPKAREASFEVFGFKITLPRLDPLRKLTMSDVPQLRALGAALWPDRLGFAGGQTITAKELSQQYFSQLANPLMRGLREAGQEWAHGRGIRWAMNTEGQDNFYTEVLRAVRAGVPEGTEPAIAKGAKVWSESYVKELKMLKKLGLVDEAVPEDPRYVPRIVDDTRMRAVIDLVGEHGIDGPGDVRGGVLSIVYKSIRKAQPELDDDLAKTIARGWLRLHRRRSMGLDARMSFGINIGDKAFFAEILREGLRGIGKTAQQADELESTVLALMDRVNKKPGTLKAGKVSNAMRRIDFDETTKFELTRMDGQGKTHLSLQDLLVNDARHIALTQLRKVAGHAAMKERLGKAMNSGEMQTYLDEIKVKMDAAGRPQGEITEAVEAAEIMMKDILGLPLADLKGGLSRFGRAVRQFNTITTMNQSGFASFVEHSFPMQRGAITYLTEVVPALKQFIRDAKTGKIDNDVLDYFDVYAGEGADDMLRPGYNRIDDPEDALFGLDPAVTGTPLADKAETILRKGAHVTLEYISGLLPMTRVTKRQSMMMQLHEIDKLAPDAPAFLRRMEELGLTPEAAKALHRGVKKAQVTVDRMLSDGTAVRTDIEKLRAVDPEAHDAMVLAMQRASQRSVIEATAGDIPPMFRTTELGKALAQFQGFGLTSYTQHFLAPISRRDAGQLIAMLYGTMLASMAYVVQQSINNAGRPKTLKKNLSLDRIALVSLARTSHASILPMLTDTASGIIFGKPVFNATVSGRPSDVIRGNPTVRAADNLTTFLGGGFQAAVRSDRKFAKEQGYAGKALLPFGNAPGVSGALNALIDSTLPKRANR